MSRIGKQPVPITKGVKVSIDGSKMKFEGPKGKLELQVHPAVDVAIDAAKNQVVVTRRDELKQSKALHGLTRALIANNVLGVAEGYKKAMDVQGVGYKAELKGKELVLTVGYANAISVEVPAALTVVVEGSIINISGPDKQLVGQFASDLRRVRKPEPYKGKGIRYQGEKIKIKPGKAVTGAAAGK